VEAYLGKESGKKGRGDAEEGEQARIDSDIEPPGKMQKASSMKKETCGGYKV